MLNPKFVKGFLNSPNGFHHLCLVDDERWRKPDDVLMGWFGQNAIFFHGQANIPGCLSFQIAHEIPGLMMLNVL